MKDLFLQEGAHHSRQDGMCAMEFAAYLAGLEHTDRPVCVSPVLLKLIIKFNDAMDSETRQKLRPYIVRTLGTADDGQDEQRAYIAADWAVRIVTPLALEASEKCEQASCLRALDPIVNRDTAQNAMRAADAAAADAADAADAYTAYAAGVAAHAAAYAAAGAAAAYTAHAAAYAAAGAGAAAGAYTADAGAYAADAGAYAADAGAYAADAADADAGAYTAHAAAYAAAGAVWESAFVLLGRIIDPAGIHDVKTEAECLSEAKSE